MQTSAQRKIFALTEKQVAKVLDGLGVTPVFKLLIFAASLGYLFDAFDNSVLGYVMPALSKQFSMNPVAKGLVISAALWGGVLGQFLWGPLADIKGRRFAFQGSLLSFSIFTGLSALAWSPTALAGSRFVTGTGLAAFVPIDTAMVSEMAPTKVRGRWTSFVPVLFPAGSLLAAGACLALVSTIGWRGMFLVGAIPALLAFGVRRMIPESPRWLASKGRGEEAAESLKKLGASEQLLQQAQATPEEAPAVAAHNVGTGAKLGELFTPRWIRSNVLSWSLWISVNFAYFGVLLWLPSILVDVYHLSIVRSLTYTVIVNSVGMAGRLLGVYLIERIGRKPLIIYTYIFAALFCLAFGNVKDPRYLLLFAAMFFFFADQSSVGVIAYIPELYPTRLRVLGSAWAAAAGRIASALAPIMAGAFMAMKMYATTWTIFAAVYIAAALITWAIGPETTGRELTELQG